MFRKTRGFGLVAGFFVAVTLSGCGYNINPYGASVQNVEAIKTQGISHVSVAPFTAQEAGQKSIMCRAAGPVSSPGDMTFEQVVERALIDELKLAGVYDQKSSIVIQGHLEEMGFNSNIGAGKWVMKVKVSSASNPGGFTVQSTHEFSTNWVADKACQQVAQAFGPALQELIFKIVSHPQFKEVAK